VNRWLFLAFLSLYLLTTSARIDSGDGNAMFQVTDSLLNGRGFVISDELPDQDLLGPQGEPIPRQEFGTGLGQYGVDGRYYAKFGPGQSFAAIPFYLIGKLAHALWPVWSEAFWVWASAGLLNSVVVALTVVLVAQAAQLFFDRQTSTIVAILFGLATPAWPYAKSFFSEPLTGGLMFLGGYAAMRARRDPHWGWFASSGLALGAAVLVRTTASLILPVVAGYLFLACRPSKTQWAVWGSTLAIPLLLLGWYNAARFGSPLITGYAGTQWDVTLLGSGLYGLLFSSGKGLVWFMPIVTLSVAALPTFMRQARAEGWLIVGVSAVFLATHSIFNYWTGGGGWGPRLILPIVVWLVLPLGVRFERKTRPAWQAWSIVVIIAASILVQALGVSVGYARHLQAVYNTSRTSEEYFDRVQFHWADSPILGQIGEWLAVTGNLRNANTRQELSEMVTRTLDTSDPNDIFYDARREAVSLLAFNAPDFWFVYDWLMGMPLEAIMIIALTLVAVLGVSVWRLRVSMNSPGSKSHREENV